MCVFFFGVSEFTHTRKIKHNDVKKKYFTCTVKSFESRFRLLRKMFFLLSSSSFQTELKEFIFSLLSFQFYLIRPVFPGCFVCVFFFLSSYKIEIENAVLNGNCAECKNALKKVFGGGSEFYSIDINK